MIRSKFVKTLLIATSLAAGVALLSATAAASASGRGQQAWACNGSPVFSAWGDDSLYVPMHALVGASEPGTTTITLSDSQSASFAGSCTFLLRPTLRLNARNLGDPDSTLQVAVQYREWWGSVQTVPIGSFTGNSDWQPSPILAFDGTLLGGGLRVVLTASANSDWQIDGVYVDPFRAR
jgi:hypothetical protein